MGYHSCMIAVLNNILGNARLALFVFAAASAAALAAAFISQYAYGLQPCSLCIYQRIPYALVILFTVLGIGLGRASVGPAKFFLGLVSITFLANSAIAAYHTGVERKWWPSFLEGCTIPKMEGNITDVLAQIEASPIVRCDEIPWTDPFLGLSMANYNVLFCLALAVAAAIACLRAR